MPPPDELEFTKMGKAALEGRCLVDTLPLTHQLWFTDLNVLTGVPALGCSDGCGLSILLPSELTSTSDLH